MEYMEIKVTWMAHFSLQIMPYWETANELLIVNSENSKLVLTNLKIKWSFKLSKTVHFKYEIRKMKVQNVFNYWVTCKHI